MRIAAMTGSRADYSAIKVVSDALFAAGHECVVTHTFDEETDLALLHGDRHEIVFMAVQYTINRTPIAHIGGGDVTEGSYDNVFRDAVTMMAQLHFVGHDAARKRLLEMRMPIDRVHVVGEPALDWLMSVELPSRETLLKRVGLTGWGDFVLLNWQPETMAEEPNRGLVEIVAALESAAPDMALLAVGQNRDRGDREATGYIRAHRKKRWRFIPTMTRIDYAAAMKYCAFMIGNSSSAMIEGPTLGARCINVGDRQKGRISQGNVFSVPSDRDMIAARIRNGPWPSMTMINLYGDGHAAARIVEVLGRIRDPKTLLKKRG